MNIITFFLTTTLIFSNLGLGTQPQGQSPWFQWDLTSAGTVPLFTGKELDSSTGLYDYSARQYDAKLGRFISADTVDPSWANPQSLNRYSYTLNNPLKYVDPSGHYVESPSDWISASMSFDEFQQNPTILSGLAFGWDVFALATPGVVGFGGYTIKGTKMLRGISKVDDVTDAARAVDKAGDVGKARGVPRTGHRYVGPKEAREIKDTGVIPNVDEYKNPKTVFYTPDKQLKSSKAAKDKYNLGEKPTHRADLDISKTKADYGGNVSGGKGIEMTTREKIPVKKLERLRP